MDSEVFAGGNGVLGGWVLPREWLLRTISLWILG